MAFLRDLLLGLSQASNQLPQAMRTRQVLQQQEQSSQQQEADRVRREAMERLGLAFKLAEVGATQPAQQILSQMPPDLLGPGVDFSGVADRLVPVPKAPTIHHLPGGRGYVPVQPSGEVGTFTPYKGLPEGGVDDEGFNDALKAAQSTAKSSGTDAAIDYMRGLYPNLSAEQEERARKALVGVNPDPGDRYRYPNNETGMILDTKSGRYVPMPGMPAPEMTQQQFQRAQAVRQDWQGGNAVKMMGAAQAGFEGAREGYFANDAAGDIALLYGYAKAVAPDDSAVREGEFATMEEAQGWFQSQMNWVPKIIEGRRLAPEARRQVWSRLHGIYRARLKSYITHGEGYADIARQSGLKPEWVIPRYGELNQDSIRLLGERDLIQRVRENPQDQEALDELKDRFGVMPGEALGDVLRRVYYKEGNGG